MGNCFRWLHLTDLHWDSNKKDNWNEVETALLDDIDHLYEVCGNEPWDAVFFTGDLVNKGQKEEFDELNKKLQRLQIKLKEKCRSKPVFLCVPGNHDLTRPNDESAAYENLCRDWEHKEKIKDDVLKEQAGEFWKELDLAFKNYNVWLENKEHEFRIPETYQKGLLTGDFSASISKNGYEIGVIGLNTSFLHLREGDFKEKLYIDPSQLSKIIGDDHNDWFEKHDCTFLLTHHPKDWLSEQGQEKFNIIAPAGRFSLHLCGHQHENFVAKWALGGSSDEYRLMQASSLFGLEKYVNWENNKTEVERLHGYCAGKIEFRESGYVMRLWPRTGIRIKNGKFNFDKDINQGLSKKDDGTNEENKEISYNSNRTGRPQNDDHKQAGQPLNHDKKNSAVQKVKSPSLKKLITSGIDTIFSSDSNRKFFETLVSVINSKNITEVIKDYKEVIRFLIDDSDDILISIGCISEALDVYTSALRQVTGNVEKYHTWECACALVEWIILSASDDEWLDKNKDHLQEMAMPGGFLIPVRSDIGVEILFSGIMGAKADIELRYKQIRGKDRPVINGKKRINLDTDIETGIFDESKLTSIKQQLWEHVNMSKDGAPEIFTAQDDAELNGFLRARARSNRHIYFTLTEHMANDHQSNEVIKKLMFQLPALNIIMARMTDDYCAIIVSERELEFQLIEFLSKKEAFLAA